MLSGWMRTSFLCSVRFGGGRECPYQTVEIHCASPTVLFLGIGRLITRLRLSFLQWPRS